jgi:hypothetical protein
MTTGTTFTSGTMTDDGNITVLGTLSTALASNEQILVKDNGVVLGTATSLAGNSWQYQAHDLANAPHTLTAVVVDAAGNTTASLGSFIVTTNATIDADYFTTSTTTAGSGGFKIAGGSTKYFATDVSAGLDMNGDGLADIGLAHQGATKALLLYGKTDINMVDANTLNSGSGFAVTGSSANFAASVALVDDMNGDGLAEMVVSDPANYKSYVVFGRTSPITANGTNIPGAVTPTGFVITNATNNSGSNLLSRAGDFNGDGLGDILLGVPNANSALVAYGKATGSAVDGNGMGNQGQKIVGPGGTMGINVDGGSDVNGDGLDDVILGATTEGGAGNGGAYVVFGVRQTSSGTSMAAMPNITTSAVPINSTAPPPSWGFFISGASGGLGTDVAMLGDINGDGLADVGVTVPNFAGTTSTGRAVVIFGKTDTKTVDVGNLATGGFVINSEPGANAHIRSISYLGDVNGDGLDDILVGAGHDVNGTLGRAYVVFGTTSTAPIELSDVARNVGGFAIDNPSTGARAFGWDVAAGDMDGDGLPDLVIGENNGGTLTNAGGWVVYSSQQVYREHMGTTPLSDGTPGNDFILGSRASNTVAGNGGADVIYTGAGQDTITLNADNVANLGHDGRRGGRVDGGLGWDTLVLSETGSALDFTHLNHGAVKGIENIDLGNHGNTLTITTSDVFHLIDSGQHRLFIQGGSMDTVALSSFTPQGTTFVSVNGVSGNYYVYTWGSNIDQLLVSTNIGHIS